jgi:hypothetical protein
MEAKTHYKEVGMSKLNRRPLRSGFTAGCNDTELPAGRRNFGQSDNPLIEIAHAHHAMWVMFSETRCKQNSAHRA